MEEKDGKSQNTFVKPNDLLREFKTLHFKKKNNKLLDSFLEAKLSTSGSQCIGDELKSHKTRDDTLLTTIKCVFLFQLRYQKCLVARPPSQKVRPPPPPADSVTRRVTTNVKRGVLSLIDTLKQKRPVTETP